jgi:putative hydrolase of the HAD superfamily
VLPPKVVFVDLDGVIRHWREPDSAIELAHGLPLGAIARSAFDPIRLLPAITGKISDDEWRTEIARYLAVTYHVRNAQKVLSEWTEKKAEIDNQVLGLLRACEQVARVVLVTNATSRLSNDLLYLELTHYFSDIINSSEIGVAKPDEAFFLKALEKAQALPSEAVFIDDAPENVQVASRLGMRSHLFLGYVDMAAFLKEQGILTA